MLLLEELNRGTVVRNERVLQEHALIEHELAAVEKVRHVRLIIQLQVREAIAGQQLIVVAHSQI